MTTENIETETKQELTKENMDNILKEYGTVFIRLLESQRFKELMSVYFTFQKVVDDETKAIDFQIIENPPEVIAKKVQAQQVQNKKPAIEVVSGGMAEKVLKQAEKAAKQRFAGK